MTYWKVTFSENGVPTKVVIAPGVDAQAAVSNVMNVCNIIQELRVGTSFQAEKMPSVDEIAYVAMTPEEAEKKIGAWCARWSSKSRTATRDAIIEFLNESEEKS